MTLSGWNELLFEGRSVGGGGSTKQGAEEEGFVNEAIEDLRTVGFSLVVGSTLMVSHHTNDAPPS